MALLGQSAFLKALGWALLNSIWQMAIVWLVYLILSASLRQLTAAIKHSLAALLLGVGTVWFACTLAVKYFAYSETPQLILASESGEAIGNLMGDSIRGIEPALPYLSSIYLVIIVFLFFRFIAQYRYTKHVSTHAVQKLQPSLRMFVHQVAGRMGIKKEIKVWLSEIVDTPMTIGFWKPVILMPIASVNGLSTQQVEAILLHELAHIRRNDYLVNLLVATVDIILFFNPFSKLFIRTIKREREHSCDDLVLQFQYNAHAYASALLAIEQKRVQQVALVMAATGKNNRMLLNRVKRILNQPPNNRCNNRIAAHIFSGILFAFIAWSNPGHVMVRTIILPSINDVALASDENVQPLLLSDAPAREETSIRPITYSRDEDLTTLNPSFTADDESAPEEEEQPEPAAMQAFAANTAFEALQYAPQALQAAAQNMRDFSITEQLIADKPIIISSAPTPYVPSASFSYYFQDSSKPMAAAVVSPEEKAAKESLKKALKALEEINWSKLEKELKSAGDKLDIARLQEEIKKSLQQVDWERINVETKLEQLQADARKRQDAYLKELTTARKNDRQMQEHYNNLQKKIVEDQIKCQEDMLKKEIELKDHLQKKNKTTPARKIVHI